MQGNDLLAMRKYLVDNCLQYSDAINVMVEQRQQGKVFTLENHLAAMIYAQLTNQTKWSRIVPHLPEIDKLFFDYKIDEILKHPGAHFSQGIFALKCGNISTKAQMDNLHKNIGTMMRIIDTYGSMDAFVTSAPAQKVVSMLSDAKSEFKMAMLGEALAWEYIRNVGIDGCKPDTHLRRFLGNARMGDTAGDVATLEETITQVERLAQDTGLTLAAIDNIIWSYCANDYGEVCTSTPHCEKCVVRYNCKAASASRSRQYFTFDDICSICEANNNDPQKIGEYFLAVAQVQKFQKS